VVNLLQTRSSAVAKRPCDAPCLSVVSFNSTKRGAQSSIISYTLALDLSSSYPVLVFMVLQLSRTPG